MSDDITADVAAAVDQVAAGEGVSDSRELSDVADVRADVESAAEQAYGESSASDYPETQDSEYGEDGGDDFERTAQGVGSGEEAPADEGTEGEEAEAGEQQEEAFNSFSVPGLNQEEQKAIAELGPEADAIVSKILARREKDARTYFHSKMSQLSDMARPYQDMGQAITPEVQNQWRLQGFTPGQKVNQYIALENMVANDPISGVEYILSQQGLSLRDAAAAVLGYPGMSQNGNPPSQLNGAPANLDPAVQHIVQNQNETIQQLQQRIEQREQQELQSSQAQVESVFMAMAQTKDDAGEPVYPHLQELAGAITPIAEQLYRQNPMATYEQVLVAAYDRAAWANPQTRQILLARQRREQEKAKRQGNKKRISQARRAVDSHAGYNSSKRLGPESDGSEFEQVSDAVSFAANQYYSKR